MAKLVLMEEVQLNVGHPAEDPAKFSWRVHYIKVRSGDEGFECRMPLELFPNPTLVFPELAIDINIVDDTPIRPWSKVQKLAAGALALVVAFSGNSPTTTQHSESLAVIGARVDFVDTKPPGGRGSNEAGRDDLEIDTRSNSSIFAYVAAEVVNEVEAATVSSRETGGAHQKKTLPRNERYEPGWGRPKSDPWRGHQVIDRRPLRTVNIARMNYGGRKRRR